MAEPIKLKHSTAAADWANSPDRADVFTVTRPNPEYEAWAAKAPSKRSKTEPPAELEHTYTCPAKPNVGLGLEFLRQARRNEGLASSWLIETAIGSDGYDALVEELAGLSDSEAQATLAAIAERIQKIVLGGLEAPKG